MEDFFTKRDSYIKILAISLAVALIFLGLYAHTAKVVTISIDGEERRVSTHADTLEDLLKQKDIALNEDAYVSLPLDSKLEDNMNVNIKMSKPYILAMGGLKGEVKSVHTQVKDILDDLGVKLDDKDYTRPGFRERIHPGTEIEIVKVEEVLEELDVLIPYEHVFKKTDRLDIGVENIIQEGTDGFKNIKIKKVFENGRLASEDVVEEIISEEPIPMIVERGTKNILVSSRGSVRYRKAMAMVATAYDSSFRSTGKNPGDRYYGITASGTKAKPGVVAVDPRIIPLGTKLYVESLDSTEDYGFCVAEDTGGAIKGNKIDLYFEKSGDVWNFGRRKVKVYVLE